METLYAIAALEVLAWCFFFKQSAIIHAAALLIFVKIFFPIIKSALLHVCWRIPRAFIKGEVVVTVKHHFTMWFGNPYKQYRNTTPLPVREPSKKEIPDVDEKIVSASMRKIDKEIAQFYKEHGSK